MNILHISNWYPSPENKHRALWIRDQIELLKGNIPFTVWHVEVIYGKGFRLKTTHLSANEHSLILKAPTRTWFFIELLSSFLLLYLFCFKVRLRNYTHLHFHIAYPLLTYWHWFKHFIKKPLLISEHWSAYHYNFNLDKSKTTRIQRIFHNPHHLVTVSEALAEDIAQFSENGHLSKTVIPNVVDQSTFKLKPSTLIPDTIFMVSQWKNPKDPFVIFQAMKHLPALHVRIGGYGEQMTEMTEMVHHLGIVSQVTFLGALSKSEIADEMNKCVAFVHSSHYETFSVVCAEAISCGCPVIASGVGGIVEFISESNGVLVHDQTMHSWAHALSKVSEYSFNRKTISLDAEKRFKYSELCFKMAQLYV